MKAVRQKCDVYQRRRPELTPCYQIVSDHLETFISEREAEGKPLPDYVIKEFNAYLKCGILAHGFIRVKCEACDQEFAIGFSCKKRGFCPSCHAKRMIESASHLVDNVLPMVPYRQFIITFPVPMRYWLQFNKKLHSKIHALVINELHQYYIDKAQAQGIKKPKPGSISFQQRFGSGCNINPHYHILCPDGVYSRVSEKLRFFNVGSITDEEVATLLTTIAKRVMKYLKRLGYLDKNGEVVENPAIDDLFKENDSLAAATSDSIAGKIAFGPNAGHYVTRIGGGFGFCEEVPLAKGHRCYSIHGFSLHANRSTNTHQRKQLEKLLEYMSRGPISNERLEITKEGHVKLKLKSRWSDGTSYLIFTPSEFLEKLVALIPPRRQHLTRWSGIFAPNSPIRKEITLKPEIKKGFQFKEAEATDKQRVKNSSWSKMLNRVFKIDVTICKKCGGQMIALAAVTDADSIKRYLKHINIDYDPRQRAPPKPRLEFFDFDDCDQYEEHEPVVEMD